MRILIVGASSEQSVGYLVGESLKQKDHGILYASRSGTLGEKCDICHQSDVLRVFRIFQPDVVIQAAGVFTSPQRLGRARMRTKMADHILVKSYGMFVGLDAAMRTPSVRHVIVFGGREVSSDPRLAVYTAANGALWALVRFAAQHLSEHFASYFIDLPLIENSTMAIMMAFSDKRPDGSLSADRVAETIEEILCGRHEPGTRIVLGEKNWTI